MNWLSRFWLSLTDGPDPIWARTKNTHCPTQREIDRIVRTEELERKASIMAAVERRTTEERRNRRFRNNENRTGQARPR